MPISGFTVVIPTYNRAHLVGRAIDSVLSQDFPTELIVVDDASTDSTAEVIAKNWPQVRYVRQQSNLGPGPARNYGIQLATFDWVLLLDDDDTLLPGALRLIAEYMESLPNLEYYPAVQFAHSNGSIQGLFRLVTIDDYFHGRIRGDFIPVIQARLFCKLNLAFPITRVGAEHLLWWRLARDFGLPTWNHKVATVHSDAPVRLTSVRQQIRLARFHAQMQDETLLQFGSIMQERAPSLYQLKRLGAATYWLLAGERNMALSRLTGEWHGHYRILAMVLRLLSRLPASVIRVFFILYRRITA